MVRSLMIAVELMGGPFDGQTVRIPSSVKEIEMVKNIGLEYFLQDNEEISEMTSIPLSTVIYRMRDNGKWWFVEERFR